MDLDTRSCAGIAFLSVVWGSSYFVGGLLLKSLDPLTIQTLRCLGSFVILGSLCSLKYLWEIYFSEQKTFSKAVAFAFARDNYLQSLWDFACVGFLYNIVGGLVVFYSQTHISAGIESVIFSLESVFAALFLFMAHKIDRSYFSPTLLGGVFISVCGVVLVSFPELTNPETSQSPLLSTVYMGLGLLSVLGYACGAAVQKIHPDVHKLDPLISVTGQFGAGVIFMVPIYFINYCIMQGESTQSLGVFLESIQSQVWITFLVWCLVCNAVCFYLFTYLINKVGPKASLYALVVPCISMTLGVCFAGEWNGLGLGSRLIELSGMCLVVMGLSVIVAQELGRKTYIPVSMDSDETALLQDVLVLGEKANSPPKYAPTHSTIPPPVPSLYPPSTPVVVDYGSFSPRQPISVV